MHVPYKGGAACQTDIMGGQIDISFQNLGAVTSYIRGNRMNALAVTAKHAPSEPPRRADDGGGGIPGHRRDVSGGGGRSGEDAARDVVAKLHDAVVKALRSPDVRERMSQIGFDIVAGTPEEFGTFMQDEVSRWTQVVNRGNIKTE